MAHSTGEFLSEGKQRRFRILLFAPYEQGGLADYARVLATALAREPQVELYWLGVTGITTPDGCRPSGKAIRAQGHAKHRPKMIRALRFMATTLGSLYSLDRVIGHLRPNAVLFVGYAEYFAPIWAWRFRRHRANGVRFGAIVHDPVRDNARGPRWWHRQSVAAAYSFLDVAFVHESVALDTVRPCLGLRTVVIPHGMYAFSTERLPRAQARQLIDVPEGVPVFLSFGHIRDGKNLDLFLRAMVAQPTVYLVVAGREQSAGQRPADHYRELARELGVATRVRWFVRHISEREVGGFFAAADYLLLTYSAIFRSASGVLASASQFRKPVLASGGIGPLCHAVQKYRLGVWIEPDDESSMRAGVELLLRHPPDPDWAAFERENSWSVNAQRVAAHLTPEAATARTAEVGKGRREGAPPA